MAGWRCPKHGDLRELESENAKLKRLLADAMVDNIALEELLSKNV